MINSSKSPVQAPNRDVYVLRKEDVHWQDSLKPGLRFAPVHENKQTGHFLGLIGFDAMASSGLHQHTGAAFSYQLTGCIRDHGARVPAGEMGINLSGATHEAIAYEPSIVVSRLDGSVLYADEGEDVREGAPPPHTGGRFGEFANPRPEDPPTIRVDVEGLNSASTAVAGLSRRLISDYHGTPHNFRSSALTFNPGTRVPAFSTHAPIEFYVVGGSFEINGKIAQAGSFCIVEAGAQVHLSSPHGAFLLAWSEAPVQWLDCDAPDIFGF